MPNNNSTPTNEPASLEAIPFHEQIIFAQRTEQNWIAAFKPICENIGLDYSSQRKRLERQKWATMVMMTTVGADGKIRDMIGIDRRTLTMWLATIDASRIKNKEARQLIDTYQKEAADALDSYFHNGGAIRVLPEDSDTDVLARAFLIATRTIEERDKKIQELTEKGEAYDAFTNVPELMLIRDGAKYLTTAGIHIRERELFAWLREHHWIFKAADGAYRGYADKIDAGYVREVPAKSHGVRKDGTIFPFPPTVRLTRVGLMKLYDEFKHVATKPLQLPVEVQDYTPAEQWILDEINDHGYAITGRNPFVKPGTPFPQLWRIGVKSTTKRLNGKVHRVAVPLDMGYTL